DVEAVGLARDRDHLRAQLVEHGRRDVVGRAVRAIHDDLEPFQIELVRERALAELDVASGSVGDAERLAELGRGHAFHRALERLHASGSLVPPEEKNLMPLSSNGLCEALITMPAERRSARVRYATAGVGRGPER